MLLCESPRIELHPNVISSDWLADIIALARPRLKGALVSAGTEGRPSQGRSAVATWMRHDDHPAIRAAVDLIAEVVGLPANCAEMLHTVKYGPGGEYRPHYDAYDQTTDRGQRCTATRGQRISTALLYLNDYFAGGNTRFPRLGIEVVPEAGAVPTFENCGKDHRFPHPRTLHAGAPVSCGEKWIATLWFRER